MYKTKYKRQEGRFPEAAGQVACYLWLGLYPSIEFLCVEHTRNLSLPPPPKSVSVVWKSQNISLTLTSRRRSCVSRDTKRVRSSTQREREIWDHRAAQGWSESCGLTNSAKNQSCPSAPGLPPLCVCSHKWNLPSQSSILNFLQRT